jgi:predicted membrane chloride channel (bestrophin family)
MSCAFYTTIAHNIIYCTATSTSIPIPSTNERHLSPTLFLIIDNNILALLPSIVETNQIRHMVTDSYRKHAHSLWSVLFRIEGNVLFAVLPFCIANCMILGLVAFYQTKQEFEFSATGHGLLTLLVSFLVISKVNLAYDRFRAVRKDAAEAFLHLRELMQMVIAISSSVSPPTTKGDDHDDIDDGDDNENRSKELRCWRLECLSKVAELMDLTVTVVKDHDLACYFARNTPLPQRALKNYSSQGPPDMNALDPMVHAQSVRMHVYHTSDLGIHLLERVSLSNKLQEFIQSYNNLLVLSSTPLPFPLVQMGRVFLFLWTFSMPLVLLGGPFSGFWGAQLFLFFLTYGFIGLELVSIKLSDPFGDSRDDVQIASIRYATKLGISADLKGMELQPTLSERRLQFSRQKHHLHIRSMRDAQMYNAGRASASSDRSVYQDQHAMHNPHDPACAYQAMEGDDSHAFGC